MTDRSPQFDWPALPEHAHLDAGRRAYAGDRFGMVELDLPAGEGATRTRAFARTRDAVVVLPLLESDAEAGRGDPNVVLIENHRPVLGRTLLELPAGTIDPGEPTDAAALRELAEETGYAATQIHRVTSFYPCPGFITEHMHAYIATGLSHVGQQLDATEHITPVILPMSQVMQHIRTGKIEDAKTMALALWWQAFGSSLTETQA